MADRRTGEVLKTLCGSMLRHETELRDGELLESFLRGNDAAVAALVQRHGPMVWAVCRRILSNHQDAEDAFQATFLVLLHKAAAIGSRELVAGWLHGVARQTSLKARATAARRARREKQMLALPESAACPRELGADWQPVLDMEIGRLPQKYRAVLLLCDLQERTRKAAAGELGLPEGTVASRLARARALLAKRLTRRGFVMSGSVLAPANLAVGAVPASLLRSTINVATLFASAPAAAADLMSAGSAALSQGVLKAMFLTKLKTLTLAAFLLITCGLGLVFLGGRTQAVAAPPDKDAGPRPVAAGRNAEDDEIKRRLLKLEERVKRLEEELLKRPEPARAEAPTALPKGMRAFGIRVEPTVAAGFIKPNVQIDVVLSVRRADDTVEAGIIMQDVKVLAIDQRAPSGQEKAAAIVTVAVTPEQALQLAQATQQGAIQILVRARP